MQHLLNKRNNQYQRVVGRPLTCGYIHKKQLYSPYLILAIQLSYLIKKLTEITLYNTQLLA